MLQPLGMNRSTFVTETSDWPDIVTAYYNDDDGALKEVSLEVPLLVRYTYMYSVFCLFSSHHRLLECPHCVLTANGQYLKNNNYNQYFATNERFSPSYCFNER